MVVGVSLIFQKLPGGGRPAPPQSLIAQKCVYNLFREIFEFREDIDTLRAFLKSVVAHIFDKQIRYAKSPDHDI